MLHRRAAKLVEQLSGQNHYFDLVLRALFLKLQDLLLPSDLDLQLVINALNYRQTPYLKMPQGDILHHQIRRRPQV